MNKDWKTIEFEKCLQKVSYTKKLQRTEFLEAGKYPIVSQEQGLINGYWDNSADLFSVKKPVVIFGDHTQIIKYVDFDFVLGADGVKILLPCDDIDSKYFYYYLTGIELKSLGYARHYRLLKEIKVPIPPLSEQKKIVAQLDSLAQQTKRLAAIYQQKLDNLDELKKSILQKAFAGELTSNEAENKLRAASA